MVGGPYEQGQERRAKHDRVRDEVRAYLADLDRRRAGAVADEPENDEQERKEA